MNSQPQSQQSEPRQLSLVEKASILTETLPWLETYAGKIVVIKYGGNAMVDDDLKRAFAQDIVFMKRCGIHPVVVHGGGPQISSMLSRLGIASEFRGGLRVTSPEAMDVVRMVLVGQVGRDLVGLINTHSTVAVGMSGEDGGLFIAERRSTVVDGDEVDLGLVGDVVSVRTEAVAGLIDSGSVPVVASIAPDVNGVVHNVNADTAAAALAIALEAERLVILTDVEGLYRDWPNSSEVITDLSASELRKLMPHLEAGMAPKMEACLRAVEGGLTRATVVDGRVPHALLLEIFTNVGIGTMVTQDGLIRLGSRVFSRDEGIPPQEYANGDFGASVMSKGDDPLGPRRAARERASLLLRARVRPYDDLTVVSSSGLASSAAVLEAYSESVMNTFGTPKRVFVRGEACYLWDADGRRYLDLLSGLAVNALGHAHPTVLSAVTGQIATLGHVSNFFATPAQVALAAQLSSMTGAAEARVFFTNSGTEANEAAFKITRMTGRSTIISTEGAFHGRSMGALALTHNPKYRIPFEPLPGEVIFVPYGDAGALASVVDQNVAAVVLEPIQGENGVVVPPEGYLAKAREICDQHRSLLWMDEVQTGMGRCGSWLVHVDAGHYGRHRYRSQGPGQRVSRRSLHRDWAGLAAARPRQPRQYLRRQPGCRHRGTGSHCCRRARWPP